MSLFSWLFGKKEQPKPVESFVPIVGSMGGNTYSNTEESGPGVKFFCTEGADKEQLFQLWNKGGSIGSAGQEITLKDPKVQAKHVSISLNPDDSFTIKCEDAAHPFMLNGVSKTEAKLSPGDTLVLGGTKLLIQLIPK